MKKKPLLIALAIALTSFTVYNKNYFEELVTEKLLRYESSGFPEKIYLHTDKPFYTQDETIWFTSYLVNGISHQKSEKSKVVHVELINENDSIVSHKKLYAEYISASGDFKIDKDLQAGKYLLRAYTSEMRNNGQEDFFHKEISIWSTKEKDETQTSTLTSNKNTASSTPVVLPRPDLAFYPEGGYLVEGTSNKVAIKIKDSYYQNTPLSGVIKDSNDNEIFEFNTLDLGLGIINLTPVSGESYYASIYINGSEERYDIPKALKVGYTLNVINKGKDIFINVKSTKRLGLKSTFLVAHQRGKLMFKKYEKSDKKHYSLQLPTKGFNDGVLNITLFDGEGNPTSERLVFIQNPENELKVSFNKSEEALSTRKKFDVNLDVLNNNDEKVPSILSMSVRDLSAFPQNTRSENIKTWLLLNSDLRGEVKNPGYFFEKKNDVKRRYLLDIVMLTHGWRKFKWNELLDDNYAPKQFTAEKGLYISGVTRKLKKPYTPYQAAARLTFLGNVLHQEPIIKSDSLGRFKFGPFVFFDSIPTLLEARLDQFKSKKKNSRDVVILVKKNGGNKSPEVVRKNVLKSNTSEEKQIAAFLKIAKYIQKINFEYDKSVKMLDEVTIKAKRRTELEKREEEMNDRTDYGSATDRFVIEDLGAAASSQSAFDILRYTRGVVVYGDSIYLRSSNGPPGIYLDGMQIDADFLQSLSGSEISFIDILTGAEAATFSNAGNGIISIYSTTGNVSSKNIKRKPGIIDFHAEGFYTAKEFYAPDHINAGPEELMKADIRTTLHWEPFIRTNKDKDSEVSFFSSDSRSEYIIEVEGISDSGIPIYGFTTFSVN
jgi:hypothetical protein